MTKSREKEENTLLPSSAMVIDGRDEDDMKLMLGVWKLLDDESRVLLVLLGFVMAVTWGWEKRELFDCAAVAVVDREELKLER